MGVPVEAVGPKHRARGEGYALVEGGLVSRRREAAGLCGNVERAAFGLHVPDGFGGVVADRAGLVHGAAGGKEQDEEEGEAHVVSGW